MSVERCDDAKIVGNRYGRDIGDALVQGLGVVPGLLSLANPLKESLERGFTYCADLLLKEDDVPELPKKLSHGIFPPLGVWLDVAAGIGRDQDAGLENRLELQEVPSKEDDWEASKWPGRSAFICRAAELLKSAVDGAEVIASKHTDFIDHQHLLCLPLIHARAAIVVWRSCLPRSL